MCLLRHLPLGREAVHRQMYQTKTACYLSSTVQHRNADRQNTQPSPQELHTHETHSDKTVADPWSWMGKYYEYKGASPTKPSTARNRRSYRCRSSSANASAYMSTTDLDY